jgi:hypothetical protein
MHPASSNLANACSLQLFFAVAAVEGMTTACGGAKNALQTSPSPAVQCRMQTDDAHLSFFRKHFSDAPIDLHTMVVTLFRALQGHPSAGALWEGTVVGALEDELAFRSATHEHNLHHGTANGETVLICWQVDDRAVASAKLQRNWSPWSTSAPLLSAEALVAWRIKATTAGSLALMPIRLKSAPSCLVRHALLAFCRCMGGRPLVPERE